MTATAPHIRQYPDVLEVAPVSRPVSGIAGVPGSKSITNRALPIAALANGESILTGALFSDDTRYMIECLRQLGIAIDDNESARTVTVRGGNGTFPASEADLYAGLSGTTMRFVAAMIALGNGQFRLDGTERMRQRPMQPLLDALNQLGTRIEFEGKHGYAPFVIHGNGLGGGECTMDGSLSSQFFTGLLQVAPYAENDVEVRVTGELVSRPYLEITAEVMRAFGVNLEWDKENWTWFRVPGGQQYQGRTYHIEPDASNATYFFAAAAITGGKVRVDGLGWNSRQGDLGFVSVLEAMGCRVAMTSNSTTVEGPVNGQLEGGRFDFNAISDTSQTLAAIAPYASGPVSFYGVAHNRVKETDRVRDLAVELRKLGQGVEEFEDGLTIYPQPVIPAEIDTYNDHRMAMSFYVTGLRTPGVRLQDPGCVAKTFPDYFDRMQDLISGS